MPKDLRVLALASYPELAAATRFRMLQYVPLLAQYGIRMEVRALLSDSVFSTLYERKAILRTAMGLAAGSIRRFRDLAGLKSFDVVFVQREAAPVGPPLVEWAAQKRRPLVLDIDDATYIPRRSEIFGSLASVLKWPRKTDDLIRWSAHVICGNPVLADYVRASGKPATVLGTIVDVARFTPGNRQENAVPVLGWIGSHSTFPYFLSLAPVFRRLSKMHQFRIVAVGGGSAAARTTVPGLHVEHRPWRLESEISDLQGFDVGVYPMFHDQWAEGKSGLKAIQYLSCGIPFVASPVGIMREIGVVGQTHLEARTEDEWYDALALLLSDSSTRIRMSRNARGHAVQQFSVERNAGALAAVFRAVG